LSARSSSRPTTALRLRARGRHRTWQALESAIGALEGGESTAFSSGMAAVSAVLEPLPVGARVVGPAVGYTGVRMLLAERAAAGRIELEEVDVTDTDAPSAPARAPRCCGPSRRPTP
jgi:cystathionine gamma-synthase